MKKNICVLGLLSSLLLCGCNISFMGVSNNGINNSNSISNNVSTSNKVSNNTSIDNNNNSTISSSKNDNISISDSLEGSVSTSPSLETPSYETILHNNWSVYASDGNSITKDDLGENKFRLNINNVNATEKWSTQFLNSNNSVTQNSTYRLEITLESSINRTIRIIFQEGTYAYYDLKEEVTLIANQEQKFVYDFTAQETKSNMLFGILTGKIGEGYEGEQTLIVTNPILYQTSVGTPNEPEQPVIPDNPGDSSAETPSKDGYNLLWADEFNGTEINKNNWTFEIGTGNWGWGNNEKQYYTDRKENAFVQDGALNIVARKESFSGSSYTSARMITKDKVEFVYGYIEARISLPSMSGIWPAFWMLGANFDDVGWPKCGEIDILEAVNDNDQVHSTLHWQYTPNKSQADHGNGGVTINDRTQFHIYAMKWTSESIITYVDDVKVFEMGINGGNGLEAFQKEHFFIMNVAVGGQWPGYNIADNFPQTMKVDYLRVYQPK